MQFKQSHTTGFRYVNIVTSVFLFILDYNSPIILGISYNNKLIDIIKSSNQINISTVETEEKLFEKQRTTPKIEL